MRSRKGLVGQLPLHNACHKRANIEVVKALLKAFPQAAEKADADGWLPLHNACRTRANILS